MVEDLEDKEDKRSYAIIGAAMEVHGILGAGFLESIYQSALASEMMLRNIPFQPQVLLPVSYKGVNIGSFRADFLCFENIILELKALPRLAGIDDAQVINYLKASSCELGLLLNFGSNRLEYRRLVRIVS